MDNTELTIKYDIDRNGKACTTFSDTPLGVMKLHLKNVFTTYKTKAGIEKCSDITHRRKILNFIIKVGTDENKKQLHDFLAEHSKLWLAEYEKLMVKRR